MVELISRMSGVRLRDESLNKFNKEILLQRAGKGKPFSHKLYEKTEKDKNVCIWHDVRLRSRQSRDSEKTYQCLDTEGVG